jgi:Flp pilus assembly protein TadG
MKKFIRYISFKNERGVSLVLVAILIIPLIAIGALVIDLGMLYAARNQLQNAADAGALAGARVLYNADGTEVNVGANQTACEAARDNSALSGSGVIAVDVNWGDGNCNGNDNNGDVQRGHWSFATGHFEPVGDVFKPPDLWNVSDEELDDVNQIRWVNAVKVVARRQATPVSALFSTV